MVSHSYDFFYKKKLGVRSRHAIVTASGYLHKFAFQGGASMSIVNYLGLHSGDPPFEVRDNFLIPELDSGASGHSRIHNFAFQGGGLRVIIGVLVYQCTGVVPVYLCTGEPVCQSTLVLVYYHDDVPVHQCRHRCTGIPLYQCTGIPV